MTKGASAKVGVAKFGALGFLAIALACAGIAAFLVSNMMNSKYTGDRVLPIVVAKTELPAGTTLRAEHFLVVDFPETSVPPGSFATVQALLEEHKGAVITVGILRGEPVVSSRVSSTRTDTGIASLLRPNMRAIALKVSDSVGFTALIYPGAFVDVIATIRDPMGRGPSARIAVQNARVMSIGMDSDVATRRIRVQKTDRLTGTTRNGGTYVTLEVTPDEAEILSIANNEGKINLVLRNPTDDTIVETTGATPTKFSAFAPKPTAESLDGDPKTTPRKKSVRLRYKNRNKQMVAHDGPDDASQSGQIETYNAQ